MAELPPPQNRSASSIEGDLSPIANSRQEVELINSATRKRKHQPDIEEQQSPAPTPRTQGLVSLITSRLSGLGWSKSIQANIVENKAGSEEEQSPGVQSPGKALQSSGSALQSEDMASRNGEIEHEGTFLPTASRGGKASAKPAPPSPNTRIARQRPAPRKDAHEIDDDIEDENATTSVKRVLKARKKAAIAKAPIVVPRTSRATSKKQTEKAVPARASRVSSRKGGANSIPQVEIRTQAQSAESELTRSKRGRSTRSRKKASSGKESLRQPEENVEEEPRTVSEQAQEKAQSDSLSFLVQQGDPVEQPGDDGVSQILLNPSPIKPTSEASGNAVSSSKSNFSRVKRGEELSAPPENFESEPEDSDMEEEEMGESPEGGVFAQDDEDGIEVIFKMSVLDQMLRRGRLVGHSWKTDDGSYYQIESMERPTSEQGRELFKRAQNLLKIYQEFVVETPEQVVESIPSARHAISVLKGLISQVLADHLLKTRRSRESIELLQDLFFFILPGLLDSLLHAAHLYTLRKDIFRANIKEFINLSTVIWDLSEGAISHNFKALGAGVRRPRRSYIFSQPTSRNLPSLKAFQISLEDELARRQQARRRKERETVRREREQLLFSQREQEQICKRKAIEENRRGQLRDIRRHLNAPITGPMVVAELEQELAKEKGMSSLPDDQRHKTKLRKLDYTRSVEVVHDNDSEQSDSQRYEQPDDGLDDNDDESGIERVSVFGNENRSRSQASRSWNEGEMRVFIEVMSNEYENPNKYIFVAEELDKSIEEVFDYAKDLQETMDAQHEKGHYVNDESEWTYWVWSANEADQRD